MFGSRQQAELLHELEQLRAHVAQLEAERARGLRLDPTTGLMTARSFRGRLSEETTRAQRYRRPLSVGILAIEELDVIETRSGFKAADELLVAIAGRLGEGVRSSDLVGRTGIDEFAILLPDTPAEEAHESLAPLIAELERAGETAVSGISVSVGIAGLEREMGAEGLLAGARIACRDAQGAR